VTADEDRLPLLLVVVGTDHHPFDRLVSWVDRWLVEGGGDRVRCVLQYGSSQAPAAPGARPYLAHAELQQLMQAADIVVSHGGPATIMECRRTDHLPIVVPRDNRRGEHVDEHQRRFAQRLSEEEMVVLCESEELLRAALEGALARPSQFRLATPGAAASGSAEVSAPVRRAGELLDGLLAGAASTTSGTAGTGRSTVLFLGGFGRSGSTLVERLVGELPGACALGEVVHLWERALRDDELCGCGERFHECPFWRKIGDVAFGGWDNLDPRHVLSLKHTVDRNRYVPQLAAPQLRPAMRRAVAEYVRLYERLYAAALQVSGATVLIDSSKHASLAFALRWSPQLDLRVLHIVRDSPGVAYSWTKRVRRPEAAAEEDYMPTYSPARAGLLWSAYNGMFELLAARGARTRRLRYEDLLADPTGSLREVASFAGLNAETAAGLVTHGRGDMAVVELSATHTVAGNPMRFDTGRVTLRRDDAWRSGLPEREQRVVTTLTAPLRIRYGYAGRTRA
jgi:UDP-N-acetylglucosamine transferase subunit ALG13